MAERRTSRAKVAPSASGSEYRPNSTAVIPISKPGGRLSVDTPFTLFGSAHIVKPPSSPELQWQLLRLDNDLLSRVSPIQLIEYLADLSPDVSRALWDFLRLCNPGWTCEVYTAKKPKDGKPDLVGQGMVDSFCSDMENLYGSFDVLIGRMFTAAFLRGALFSELVLDLDGKKMVDWATPDPSTIRFVRFIDLVRGPIWQLSQWQNKPAPELQAVAGYVPLTWPTIQYIPIDPFPGNPYGRAIAAPALFSSLFLLGLLHDLRRVIAQQGYPRLDISIDMERIRNSMPSKVVNDPVAYKAWVDDTITEVKKAYAQLQPDDTFVHTSVIVMNRPQGVVDSSSLGAVDGLIEALERMNTRALKTMPFMMASTQTTTETLANREWEVQTAGIKSIQHYMETMINTRLNLGMRAQGHIGFAQWTFAQLRATEAQSDAQTEAITINNEFNKYAYGLNDHNTFALAVTNHDEAAPEALYIPKAMITSEAANEDLTASGDEQLPNGDPTPKTSTTKGRKLAIVDPGISFGAKK